MTRHLCNLNLGPLQVGSDTQPSPKGRLVPFPPHDGFDRKTGKALPLMEMRGENILLTLPRGMFQVTNHPSITSILCMFPRTMDIGHLNNRLKSSFFIRSPSSNFRVRWISVR